MDFGVDNEILEDFLIEAGEILEQLSEQLVELEQSPNDSDLLNAIFRGFHTVKGGSGFLSLTPMVDACHGAENIFDTLRNHKRTLTPELMDVVLASLDAVNGMFEELQNGQEMTPASEDLIASLHYYAKPEDECSEEAPKTQLASTIEDSQAQAHSEKGNGIDALCQDEFDSMMAAIKSDNDTESASDNDSGELISENEFESLLDELHGKGNGPTSTSSEEGSEDIISENEFESLLDELHGAGKGPSSSKDESTDLITENEFEALLNELHGEGKGPTPMGASSNFAPGKPAATAPQKPTNSKSPSPSKKPEATVRVDTSTLDNIMNMVGELVLVRNRLLALGNTIEDEELSKVVGSLDAVTADLQAGAMKTRMQPIKKVFGRFPRVVRDLARSLDKKIDLKLVGEDTDLDKNLVEALADPLVHLVRNSVDHGIELPTTRAANGKPETGTVILSASQEGDHILLSIEDDGAGMDAEKLKRLAIERGILDEDTASRMADEAAYQLIFEPGFSTKQEISDISGRGVGMDVVKTSLTNLSGTINVHSQLGKGTRIEIKVPLTLAILPALMIGVLSKKFALPLTNVKEIINLDAEAISKVDGYHTIYVREKPIPLFYLEDWLCGSSEESGHASRHVIVIQSGTQTIGFVVTNLIGQEEVVIKPLDNLLKGTPGMAGATITSDGGIALIIDIPHLIEHYAGRS